MTNEQSHRNLCGRKCARTALTVLLTGILLTFGGPAESIEFSKTVPSSKDGADEASPLSSYTISPRSAIVEDKCLSLLKTVRYDSQPSAMDRNRRSAGAATALGLVFGVRFALGPKEVMKSSASRDAVSFQLWETDDRDTNGAQALAIADYRRCKNEQSLRALSDWGREE